jgi:hypothetical protein
VNHLEELTKDWLEYRGYFVRQSVLVGPRANGGYEGELDIVALNPVTRHLLHVECSLDALSWDKRDARFAAKFERGRRFVPSLFDGLDIPDDLDQVCILLMAGTERRAIGGGRIVRVADMVAQIMQDVGRYRPEKSAVPSGYPLLRTLQLAANFAVCPPGMQSLIPSSPNHAHHLQPQGL